MKHLLVTVAALVAMTTVAAQPPARASFDLDEARIADLEQRMAAGRDTARSLAEKYLARHERSNMKKRDGWVRDFNVNVIRAVQAGQKPLRWDRWIPF